MIDIQRLAALLQKVNNQQNMSDATLAAAANMKSECAAPGISNMSATIDRSYHIALAAARKAIREKNERLRKTRAVAAVRATRRTRYDMGDPRIYATLSAYDIVEMPTR